MKERWPDHQLEMVKGRMLPWPVSTVLLGDFLSRVYTLVELRDLQETQPVLAKVTAPEAPLLRPFYPEHTGTRTAELHAVCPHCVTTVTLSSWEQTPLSSILVTLMLSWVTSKSNPHFTGEKLSQDPCFLVQQILHNPPTEKTTIGFRPRGERKKQSAPMVSPLPTFPTIPQPAAWKYRPFHGLLILKRRGRRRRDGWRRRTRGRNHAPNS